LPPDNPPDNGGDIGEDAGAVIGGDAGEDVRPDAGADAVRTFEALEAHVGTLKDALAKAETRAERERDRADDALRDLVLAQAAGAVVPALRDTISALKTALETEKGRVAELRAERDRLAARRRWWWRRAG
jgi:hypothetical protein